MSIYLIVRFSFLKLFQTNWSIVAAVAEVKEIIDVTVVIVIGSSSSLLISNANVPTWTNLNWMFPVFLVSHTEHTHWGDPNGSLFIMVPLLGFQSPRMVMSPTTTNGWSLLTMKVTEPTIYRNIKKY